MALVLYSNVGRPVTRRQRAEEVMHLAVVACGDRLDETLTMVKSALLFSLKKITFHIFAEDPLAPQFKERVRSLAFRKLLLTTINYTFVLFFCVKGVHLNWKLPLFYSLNSLCDGWCGHGRGFYSTPGTDRSPSCL